MKPLVINQADERVPREWLARWLRGLSRLLARRRHEGLSRKEVVVVFAKAAEMRRLNRQYAGHDYATDILSFESADTTSVGELVLCLPTVRAQARHSGLSERGELGYMLVHGVLHLLGYDHAGPAAEQEMFALQDQLYGLLEKRVGLR